MYERNTVLPKRRVKKKGGDLSENEEPVEVELAKGLDDTRRRGVVVVESNLDVSRVPVARSVSTTSSGS